MNKNIFDTNLNVGPNTVVEAVTDDTVTAFSTEFTRDETKDIVIR